jgi:thymidine kinase
MQNDSFAETTNLEGVPGSDPLKSDLNYAPSGSQGDHDHHMRLEGLGAHEDGFSARLGRPYGELTVICGPMFSGKSTSLLKRILSAREVEHRGVLVLKPSFDTRYGLSRIASHDGLSTDAIAIAEWPELPDQIDIVFIDEVQFMSSPRFDGDVVGQIRNLLERGIHVVVSGLDMDWRGHPFPITAHLMAMADFCEKRHAYCSVCGKPAPKTHKKMVNGFVVELGEADLYEPRCNNHWNAR